MTNTEYLDMIAKLKLSLNQDNAETINEKLDELFQFKPVPVEWFITKAETMQLLGMDTSEYDYLLYRKYKIQNDPAKLSEIIRYFINRTEAENNDVDKKRFLFHLCSMNNFNGNATDKETAVFYDIKNKSDLLIQQFINNDDISSELIENIVSIFYIQQDFIMCTVFEKLYKKLFDKKLKLNDCCTNNDNHLYLEERLENAVNETFILVSERDIELNCRAAAKAVSLLGASVFIIGSPTPIETENKCSPASTVQISLDNAVRSGNIISVPAIELIYNNEVYCDNTAYLIDYINQDYSENNLTTVISGGHVIDKLCCTDTLNKSMERLSKYRSDYFEKNMAFAWCGSYLSYISNLYKFDAEKAINQPEEYDFSIIIPARNSSDTLRYTIQTCLNINYSGTYEIIISDNSTGNNQEIINLVNELNDSRIKYYKTPREFILPKSFEFAFLKSKGKFIIPLGSDDGILPWSLEVLHAVLEQVDVPILRWDRGFYAWPGFNGGQQNQFIIPSRYTKDNVNVKPVKNTEFIYSLCCNPQNMYTLPLLYINSGFKRSYLKTLLKKTCRMWDGPCQDIYMGIINIAINKEIMILEYPITIAGMSGHSVGANTNASKADIKKSNRPFKNSKEHLIGYCSRSVSEKSIPQFWSDNCTLYNCIFRAAARGLWNKEFILSTFKPENIYINSTNQINKDDIMAEEDIYRFKNDAAAIGPEFSKWFDENIYPKLTEITNISFRQRSERIYNIGFLDGGGIMLDGSDFNVTNIAEAVNLFEKLTGL